MMGNLMKFNLQIYVIRTPKKGGEKRDTKIK